MFKKKSSIKATLSAVMASFLICLGLGEFTFAEKDGIDVVFDEDANIRGTMMMSGTFDVGDTIGIDIDFKNPYDHEVDGAALVTGFQKVLGDRFEMSDESTDRLSGIVVGVGETLDIKLEGRVRT